MQFAIVNMEFDNRNVQVLCKNSLKGNLKQYFSMISAEQTAALSARLDTLSPAEVPMTMEEIIKTEFLGRKTGDQARIERPSLPFVS